MTTTRIEPSESTPVLTWGAPTMKPVVSALNRVAGTGATVLLTGESGTGKEVAARVIHARSKRADGPFVVVNCGALTPSLLESELFGHEKGAFTGAEQRRRGCIERANGGTILLDEIGELPMEMQTRFLRVLQERRVRPVGAEADIEVDVRFIAATHRDLPAMIAEGAFRADLYHRLVVFPIHMPPLRARRVDIPHLADVLLDRIIGRLGFEAVRLSADARAWLVDCDWPGNVRALANALERAAILADGGLIEPEHLIGPAPVIGRRGGPRTLREVEREAIEHALVHTEGHRRQAAELLGIGLRTLYDKLKRYDLG